MNNFDIIVNISKNLDELSGLNVGQEHIVEAMKQLASRLNYDFSAE